jgi:hypothetical protein
MLRLADTGLRRLSSRFREVGLCRKRRYSTRGAAEAAMRSLIRRELHRPEDGRLHAYQCPRCLTWHVGHDGGEGER